MKLTAALLPFTLSLGAWACSDKSKFRSEVRDQSPQILQEGAFDTNGSGGGKSDADSGDSGSPGSGIDDGTAGGNSNNDALGALTDKHAVSLKVDVVFAIDTSGSMNDEIAATQANLGRMVSLLNSGRLDSRIHMMMDRVLTVPAGVDAAKIAFVNQAIGSTNAISRLTALFAGTYAAQYLNAQGQAMATPLAFRKEAKLEVVVISDDNGRGNGNLAANFDPTNALKATFNSIVGLPTSVESNICELANVGTEYMTLSTQTKGSALDICSVDWSNLITRLSNDIVKRSVTYVLSKKPADLKNIVVILDGKKLAAADWTYDAAQNAVVVLKTDLVKDGSQVSINYNPAP